MCYDAIDEKRADIALAEHRGDSKEIIDRLYRELEGLYKQEPQKRLPLFHASGFAHPDLLVFTNTDPYKPQLFTWGLLPAWFKAKNPQTLKTEMRQFMDKTLNARGEEMWEKPSYRSAAKNKRCLIYLDAFYEHHHANGKTYPFHISMKEKTPLVLAGIWEEWADKETGEILNTVSIVTCEGNPTMARIHNNPKAEGPRMPVILTKETQNDWLLPCKTEEDKKHLQSLIKPFDEERLNYYTVRQLRGKNGSGNKPVAKEYFHYEDLVYPV